MTFLLIALNLCTYPTGLKPFSLCLPPQPLPCHWQAWASDYQGRLGGFFAHFSLNSADLPHISYHPRRALPYFCLSITHLNPFTMAGIRKPAISPQVKQQIIWDFHNNHLSYYALAKKYGISDHTAKRVVLSNPADYRAPAPVVWEPLQTRSRQEAAQRMEELTLDALSVAELTMQAMLRTLSCNPEKLNPRELGAFMSITAPYTMARMQACKSIPVHLERKTNQMFKEDYNASGKGESNTLSDEF